MNVKYYHYDSGAEIQVLLTTDNTHYPELWGQYSLELARRCEKPLRAMGCQPLRGGVSRCCACFGVPDNAVGVIVGLNCAMTVADINTIIHIVANYYRAMEESNYLREIEDEIEKAGRAD